MKCREDHASGFHFVTVSDTGSSHRSVGLPNQDAVSYVSEGEDFALAVSDGVGSCAQADVGSQAAVDAVCEAFFSMRAGCIKTPVQLTSSVLTSWKASVPHRAMDDCCATIKAALKLGSRMVLMSLGDGLLVAASGNTTSMAPTDMPAFANQTRCLSSNTLPDDIWTTEMAVSKSDSLVVLICTDGVANHLQEGREIELAKEIEHGLKPLELRAAIESLVTDISEYSSDDRTIGVVKYE